MSVETIVFTEITDDQRNAAMAPAYKLMEVMQGLSRTHGFYDQHLACMQDPKDSTMYMNLHDAVVDKFADNYTLAVRIVDVYRAYTQYCDYVQLIKKAPDTASLRSAVLQLNAVRFPKQRHPEMQALIIQTRIAGMLAPERAVVDLCNVLRNRAWHHREVVASPMHPAILTAWGIHAPNDEVQLVMEWPHASEKGAHMIAYTRDEKYGEADRQVAVNVSKYLARHFSEGLSSDAIRDIAALYCEADIGIVTTMPEMLDIIINGPGSCMSGNDKFGLDVGEHHPYEAYDPEFGWSMAYVKQGGMITGRALLNDNAYVRTYRGSKDVAYSQSDDRLNAWLTDNGYEKRRSWVGCSLKRIGERTDCGFLAPYLDGDDKDVNVHDSKLVVVSEGEGEFICNETCGNAENRGEQYTCDACGDRMGEDDMTYIGYNEDTYVCESCRENSYVYATGRRGNEYYVHESHAIEVDGDYYDSDYLSDNDIVQLHDGDYTKLDDVVHIGSVSEYYLADDEDVCYTKAGEHELRDDCVELADGEWCLVDDAWMCEHSNEWYDNDVDSVQTKCGLNIHPDYADEYEPEDDEDFELTGVKGTEADLTESLKNQACVRVLQPQ